MSRSFHAIFCDDVRQELNGKYSIIGEFSRSLFVEEFPTIIPKLCIVVFACHDEDLSKSNYTIEIRQDNEVLATQEVDIQDLVKSLPTIENKPDYSYIPRQTKSIFSLSPVRVERRKYIDVYVMYDDQTVQMPGILIDQAPEGSEIVFT